MFVLWYFILEQYHCPVSLKWMEGPSREPRHSQQNCINLAGVVATLGCLFCQGRRAAKLVCLYTSFTENLPFLPIGWFDQSIRHDPGSSTSVLYHMMVCCTTPIPSCSIDLDIPAVQLQQIPCFDSLQAVCWQLVC